MPSAVIFRNPIQQLHQNSHFKILVSCTMNDVVVVVVAVVVCDFIAHGVVGCWILVVVAIALNYP